MMTMKAKPPKDLHLQCETCGVPVETVEARRIQEDQAVAGLEPCGHEMSFPLPTPCLPSGEAMSTGHWVIAIVLVVILLVLLGVLA